MSDAETTPLAGSLPNSQSPYPIPKGAHCVYWAFGEFGLSLYVGVTSDFPARFKAHQRKPWWPEVEGVGVAQFPTRAAADQAEQRAIDAWNPKYNIARTYPYYDWLAIAAKIDRYQQLRESFLIDEVL